MLWNQLPWEIPLWEMSVAVGKAIMGTYSYNYCYVYYYCYQGCLEVDLVRHSFAYSWCYLARAHGRLCHSILLAAQQVSLEFQALYVLHSVVCMTDISVDLSAMLYLQLSQLISRVSCLL